MQINHELLAKEAKPFVALLCPERVVDDIRLQVRDNHDDVIRVVRGKKSYTKQSFLDEIAAALQFPYYFGENWDAFSECINDLTDWMPANSYTLLISDADQLLCQESYDQFLLLIQILERAAKRWGTGFNAKRYTLSQKGDDHNQRINKFTVVFQFSSDSPESENFRTWLSASGVPTLIK